MELSFQPWPEQQVPGRRAETRGGPGPRAQAWTCAGDRSDWNVSSHQVLPRTPGKTLQACIDSL